MNRNHINLHDDPFENLKKMPLMTSDDYKKLSMDALQTLGNDIYLVDTSSGTSGTPKKRFLTLQDEYLETEQMLRIFQYSGFDSTDRIVFLDIWFPNMYPLFVRAANLMGIKDVYAFGMHNDIIATIRKISELDFTVLITIPSVVLKLFTYISDKAINANIMKNLKKVLFFGEGFSHLYKSTIDKLFDIQIFNYYGSTELGCIGCDCITHKGIHIFEDMFYIELMGREKDDPLKGELVLTTLHMDGMPLIRYRIKDVVELNHHACDCGSPFSRVNLIGRSDDMISIYGSKYHIHQFDDILTSVMGFLPEYKIHFTEQVEHGENGYMIKLVLPREAKKWERKILHKILMLETVEFYVNANYLKVMFEYTDAVAPGKVTRKTDRLTKLVS
jgi:phenylacetate-CoA ligase